MQHARTEDGESTTTPPSGHRASTRHDVPGHRAHRRHVEPARRRGRRRRAGTSRARARPRRCSRRDPRTRSERLAAAVVEMATRPGRRRRMVSDPDPCSPCCSAMTAFRRRRARQRSGARPRPRRAVRGCRRWRRCCSTDRSRSSRHRRPVLHRALRDERSRCATGTASTPRAATCPLLSATSTTSSRSASTRDVAINGRLECRPHNRDATKHDDHAVPLPARPITEWDVLRFRLRRRWRDRDRPRRVPAA